MPNYQICYLDAAGALLGTFSAKCAGDKEAKIMAHAMRLSGTKRIEVWNGAALVYERPQTQQMPQPNTSPHLYAAE